MATAGSDKDVTEMTEIFFDLTIPDQGLGTLPEVRVKQQVLIHVINIGQGDSILVELGEHNNTVNR